MRKRKQAAIWVVVLSIISGLIVWNAVHWHSSGMYLQMFNWLQTGRGYISVLYNLGLMLVSGILLGFLIGKITDLIGYGVSGTKQTDEEENQQQ